MVTSSSWKMPPLAEQKFLQVRHLSPAYANGFRLSVYDDLCVRIQCMYGGRSVHLLCHFAASSLSSSLS